MDSNLIIEKIKSQREHLKYNPLLSVQNRINALKLLRTNIKLLEDEIFDALKKDLNKSKEEAYMCEVGMVLSEINYMIKHIKKFAKSNRKLSPLAQFPAKSYSMPVPYGIVLIISPWNYPFMLALEPLVDAISAGNLAVVKPSGTTKNVQAVIEKLLKMTFPEQQVLTVMGGRDECDFLLEQEFDYIFFTGSSSVGKMIHQKAAQTLTPITLELGGKSPCIVDETANIQLTARRLVFGKFMNAGQTCIAPDYVYCHSSVKDELIKEIERQIILQYSTHPLENDNYPRIINQKQFDGLVDLLQNEKVIFGGKFNQNKLKIEPTIIEADWDSIIMQNEIFGPLLPIITFDRLGDAIENIRMRNKPLALYIFSSSKENQNRAISTCDFGGGCINDCIIHLATSRLGFGGVKQSGMGAYHGKIGFDTFSHYKSIVNKRTWLDLPMRYQPMNKIKYFFIRRFLK
ncbi:MAG: aldehyde dehydrogenase [Clostridiales bacterium]|nr:aldehyde dehydrogenase [Clostridiales bacterium]